MAPGASSPLSSPDENDVDEWNYELVPAEPLPMIDLTVSVLSILAGTSVDARFFSLMRNHYRKFITLFRLGTLCMVFTFLTPAPVGYILTGLTACLCGGSMVFSVLMMSWELLRRTLTMQEVVFMTIMNWFNWMTMAVLFSDFRSFLCVLQAWAIQLSILSDSMFRTILSASRTSFLALPLLVICVVSVFLRQVDVPTENFMSVHVNNIDMELVDVFLNVSATLSLLVARNVYRQRRAIAGASTRLIPCAMLKAKLTLTPAKRARLSAHRVTASPAHRHENSLPPSSPPPRHTASLSTSLPTAPLATLSQDLAYLQRLRSPAAERPRQPQAATARGEEGPSATAISPAALRVPVSSRGLRRAAAGFVRRMSAVSYTVRSALITRAYDRSTPHLQQLRLVPTRLKFVDSRTTLVARLTPQHDWSTSRRIVALVSGLTSLLFVVHGAMQIDRPRPHWIPPEIQRGLRILSCSLSLVVVASTIVAAQTTLLRLLTHNFDVLFNLVQFVSSAVCLCAMVDWDERCLVPLTLGVWFVWILCLDAITPRIRRRMGLTKKHASAVLLAVMASLLRVVWSLTFDADNGYTDSEITQLRISNDVRIQLRVKTFFLNRMFPLTVWAVRVLWELLGCAEDELVFVRGVMEYYCPLEMLPIPTTRIVPAAAT